MKRNKPGFIALFVSATVAFMTFATTGSASPIVIKFHYIVSEKPQKAR